MSESLYEYGDKESFNNLSDNDVLEIVAYMANNKDNFEIVAKQINDGSDSYLTNPSEARSVLNELDCAYKGGANCGVNGFIYYVEMEELYEENYEVFDDYLDNMANEFGCKNGMAFAAEYLEADFYDYKYKAAQAMLSDVANYVMETDMDDLKNELDLELGQTDENNNEAEEKLGSSNKRKMK